MPNVAAQKLLIFDTTLRDGELALPVKMSIAQKLSLVALLESMRIDVLEVGYPGAFQQDFEAVYQVSQQVKAATVCALAGSQTDQILSAASALKPALKGRINVFTPVRLSDLSQLSQAQTLDLVRESVTLARNHCAEVQWSAFDATRSDPDFLCRTVEAAIASGATVISIPDSVGSTSPEAFSALLEQLQNSVPNIDQATLAVHCHDDLGLAVANSLAALKCGVRQIEASINGLGARAGNADLGKFVQSLQHDATAALPYTIDLELAMLAPASEFVSQITRASQ